MGVYGQENSGWGRKSILGDKMKIKFLGTGSAFTLKNYQSNFIIEQNGKRLLLDAGGDIRFSLRDAGLSYKDIDGVYISHLHQDHIGGTEAIAFCSYFDPSMKDKKIKLYGSGELLRRGWEDSWKGGLESVQGKLLSLSDFFNINSIKPNGSFWWESIQFDLVQSTHVMNGYCIVPCYGLMIRHMSKTIFWTADCQFCPHQILDFYKQADLIIQDCEVTNFKSGVHANFMDLATLPEDIKKKMILIHYQDDVLDGNGNIKPEWSEKETKAGFGATVDFGFAVKGQELDVDAMLKSLEEAKG
jgi:ribonuclease BN (tRNA processing enzyme)